MTPPAPRRRAAAVVIDQGHLLAIRRRKDGRIYSVLPGGGIEYGETPRDACLRELMEETGLDGRIIVRIDAQDVPAGHGATTTPGTPPHEPARETYFLVAASGTPVLGGPEAGRSTPQNSYEPQWVPLAELDTIQLVPASARDAVETARAMP